MNEKMEIEKELNERGMIWLKDIPDLKDGEIYISHVGDGEYQFNVFGGVYTDKKLLYDSFLKAYERNRNETIIFCRPKDEEKSFSFYRFWEPYFFEIARVTIETLNPEEFNLGWH